MKSKNKVLNKVIMFVPIICVGIILFLSSYLFEKNSEDTYQRSLNSRIVQIEMMAAEVDSLEYFDKRELSERELIMLKASVEQINEQDGVYCFLFDSKGNILSDYSANYYKQQKGEAIVSNIKTGNYTILENKPYAGKLETNVMSETLGLNWRGVPTGEREDCELFIVLAVSRQDMQENWTIVYFKIMVGVLVSLLAFSVYDSLLFRIKEK